MTALLCARCRHAISDTDYAVDIMGLHEHRGTNPSGHEFAIRCFAAAQGIELASNPSREWSWFPGYAWRVADCAACHEHIGWHYERDDSRFWGLIADRLAARHPPT